MAGTSPAMTKWVGHGKYHWHSPKPYWSRLAAASSISHSGLSSGLGVTIVAPDRRHLFHQLGMVGRRQVDDLAALLGPGLALADQEIDRPGQDFRLRLPSGGHHDALKIGRQAVEDRK